MTDLEINKALALAIGWQQQDVLTNEPYSTEVEVWFERDWVRFDYHDWNVVGPIAARYDLFPKQKVTSWVIPKGHDFKFWVADTPQKAIALAVIGSKT